MSVPQLLALSSIEIVGDFAFKEYANKGGVEFLAIGLVGYVGVVIALIVSLQGSSVLMVNGGWDGISLIVESIAAYLILGERFDNYSQYMGVVFIIIGLFLLKIPWTKPHAFRIPSYTHGGDFRKQ
jgi:multidrug transporter EmrE-like cation transporter